MEETLDLSAMTAEEKEELLKKRARRKSANPMGTIYPQKIRELLATTDLSRPVFKEYEEPIIMRVPKMPVVCPQCGKSSNHHLDHKFMRTREKCFDCIIKEENEIRLAGLWDEYEKWKILENQLAWLKDVRDETDDYLRNNLKEELQFIREDGQIEKWNNPNFERDRIFITDKYKEVLKAIEKIESELAPLREKFNYNEPMKKIKEKNNGTTNTEITERNNS